MCHSPSIRSVNLRKSTSAEKVSVANWKETSTNLNNLDVTFIHLPRTSGRQRRGLRRCTSKFGSASSTSGRSWWERWSRINYAVGTKGISAMVWNWCWDCWQRSSFSSAWRQVWRFLFASESCSKVDTKIVTFEKIPWWHHIPSEFDVFVKFRKIFRFGCDTCRQCRRFRRGD